MAICKPSPSVVHLDSIRHCTLQTEIIQYYPSWQIRSSKLLNNLLYVNELCLLLLVFVIFRILMHFISFSLFFSVYSFSLFFFRTHRCKISLKNRVIALKWLLSNCISPYRLWNARSPFIDCWVIRDCNSVITFSSLGV